MDIREGKGTKEEMPIPMKLKRKLRPKKLEFDGWGSKLLIEFLKSLGKDTNQKLSQYEVANIIKKYVHETNLVHPAKKKKVVCDGRLQSLFGKSTISRNRIYDLLEAHFTENQYASEDDSSEENEEDSSLACKSQQVSSSTKITACQKESDLEIPKACFAAIVPENIKLLYLKKTLVQDLLRNPGSFEGKLVGSYIRIKCDPYDCFQKNTHQLHPVTGVKNIPENGDVGKEVFLKVPNMTKDIPIGMLSDANFSKEECEDLRQRGQEGLLKRPTVGEVEEKAQTLHEDITKHWLLRELKYLQNLIDRANEKGWRKELFEYLERRELLKKPSEQSRLLLEVPKVIADDLHKEATVQKQDAEQDVKPLNGSSPSLTIKDALNTHIGSGSGADLMMPSHGSDTTALPIAFAFPPQVAVGGRGQCPTKGIPCLQTPNEDNDNDNGGTKEKMANNMMLPVSDGKDRSQMTWPFWYGK